MRSSVACMLVLAACVEHEPAPDMEAEQLACQALGPHCDGDTTVRCKVDHPDPIEQVLGIGTRTYEVRTDCAGNGMTCRPRADDVECAYPTCGGIVELGAEPYQRVDVRFARDDQRGAHACAAEMLDHEEVIIELVAGTELSTPTTFWISGLANDEVALIYAEPPCAGASSECALADRKSWNAQVTLEAGEVRYLVIDAAGDPKRIGEERTITIVRQQCGDAFRADGEQCDDGNFVAGDGCNASCEVEPGYFCDDYLSVSDCAYMIGTCSSAHTLGAGAVRFDTAYGRREPSFGQCAASPDYFVVFAVEVPAHHELIVSAPGHVRISETCSPTACASDDGTYRNDTDAPIVVKVWTSAASNSPGQTAGTAQISLAPAP